MTQDANEEMFNVVVRLTPSLAGGSLVQHVLEREGMDILRSLVNFLLEMRD